jgi:DNA-binding LacI/PurR family transcriptional regulator
LSGYRAAVEAAGHEVDPALIVGGEFTQESGFAATLRLLEDRPEVDAIFAASDLTAMGAIRAIERSGRRVYDDVAVVGFDDIGEAALMQPALTTIRQPIADLGATMSQRLLERIAGGEPPKVTILPVELIKRQTA